MMSAETIRDIMNELEKDLDANDHGKMGPFRLDQAVFVLILGGDESAREAFQRQKERCLKNPGACVLLQVKAISDETKQEETQQQVLQWLEKELAELQRNPGGLTNLSKLSLCPILYPEADIEQLRAVSNCVETYGAQVIFEWCPFLMMETGKPEKTPANEKRLSDMEEWMQEQDNCLRCGVLCSLDNRGFAVPAESRLQIPLLTACLFRGSAVSTDAQADPYARDILQNCIPRNQPDKCFYTARTAAITANRKLRTWQRMQTILSDLLKNDMEAADPDKPEQLKSRLKEQLSSEMDDYRSRLLQLLPNDGISVLTAPLWGVMAGDYGASYFDRLKQMMRETYITPVRQGRTEQNAETEKKKLLSKAVDLSVRNFRPFRDWELITDPTTLTSVLGLKVHDPDMQELQMTTDQYISQAKKELGERMGSVCSNVLKSAFAGAEERVDNAKKLLDAARSELQQRSETQSRIYLAITMNSVIGRQWKWELNDPRQEGPLKGLKDALAGLLSAEKDAQMDELRKVLKCCAQCAAADLEESAGMIGQFEENAKNRENVKRYVEPIKEGCKAPVRFPLDKQPELEIKDILLSPQESTLYQNGWDKDEKEHSINLICGEDEIRLIRYYYAFCASDLSV